MMIGESNKVKFRMSSSSTKVVDCFTINAVPSRFVNMIVACQIVQILNQAPTETHLCAKRYNDSHAACGLGAPELPYCCIEHNSLLHQQRNADSHSLYHLYSV